MSKFLPFALFLSINMRWSCLCQAMGSWDAIDGAPKRPFNIKYLTLKAHHHHQHHSRTTDYFHAVHWINNPACLRAVTSRSQGQTFGCWCLVVDRHYHTSAPLLDKDRTTTTKKESHRERNSINVHFRFNFIYVLHNLKTMSYPSTQGNSHSLFFIRPINHHASAFRARVR